MKFSDFIDVRDGTHESPKATDKGKKLITTKNLSTNHIDFSNAKNISVDDFNYINERSNVEKYDILLSMIGTVGNVYQEKNDNPDYAIKNLALLKFHGDELLSTWMNYYLQSEDGQNKIKQKLNGSTQQFISLKELRNLEIELPTKKEMETKSRPLNLIDGLIQKNNQINDNLLELAKALFHEKFSYDDEVLLSNYFLPKRGKNLLKRNVVNGYIPVVAGGLTPAAFHNKSNTESPVITISSSGANAGYTQIWGQKVWSSDSSYIDKTVTNNIYFWYLLIKSHQKQIFDSQTGSAQPHVYPRDIGNILIPKINEVVAKKVDKAVTPVFQKIFQNKDENKKLENIKAVLLDKYFD